jgi:hypothetical protein
MPLEVDTVGGDRALRLVLVEDEAAPGSRPEDQEDQRPREIHGVTLSFATS